MLNLKEIQKKITPILEKYDIKNASIFGSFARGDENKSSDVDVLVELGEQDGLFTLVRLKRELEKKIKIKVDLLTYNSVHRFIKKYIKKDAVKIYGKK